MYITRINFSLGFCLISFSDGSLCSVTSNEDSTTAYYFSPTHGQIKVNFSIRTVDWQGSTYNEHVYLPTTAVPLQDVSTGALHVSDYVGTPYPFGTGTITNNTTTSVYVSTSPYITNTGWTNYSTATLSDLLFKEPKRKTKLEKRLEAAKAEADKKCF